MAPCLHTTCGGCLTDWFQKNLDCPTCRGAVTTVSKAFQQKNTIDMLLEVKPSLQQKEDERKELDSKNVFREIDKFEVGVDSPLIKLKNRDSYKPDNDKAAQLRM